MIAVFFLACFVSKVEGQAPQTEWIQSIGKPGTSETGRGAYQIPGGGYVLGGNGIWETSLDLLLVKFDLNGDSIWSLGIGTTNMNENIFSFDILPDGRYLTAGASHHLDPKGQIMVLSADGATQYIRNFGGDEDEFAMDALMLEDSSIVFTGMQDNESTDMDITLSITDKFGNPQVETAYVENEPQGSFCLEPAFDGGYVVVGQENVTPDRGMILKYDSNGVMTSLSHIDSDGDVDLRCVRQLPDSSYIITGFIRDINTTLSDLFLSKRDKNLVEIWSTTLGDADKSEMGMSIAVVPDGGFVVGGQRQTAPSDESDLWALRFDENGDMLWTKTVGTAYSDALSTIALSEDGGYIMCGSTMEGATSYKTDMLVIKLGPETITALEEWSSEPQQAGKLSNFPNPFNSTTTIKYQLDNSDNVQLSIYNSLGEKVCTLVKKWQDAGPHTFSFNGENLPGGIYYIELSTGDFRWVEKTILIK